MTYRNLTGVIREMNKGTSSPMLPTVQPDGSVEKPVDDDVPSQAPISVSKDELVARIQRRRQQNQKKIIDNP